MRNVPICKCWQVTKNISKQCEGQGKRVQGPEETWEPWPATSVIGGRAIWIPEDSWGAWRRKEQSHPGPPAEMEV